MLATTYTSALYMLVVAVASAAVAYYLVKKRDNRVERSRLVTIGLEMPDDFPSKPYNEIHQLIQRIERDSHPHFWDNYGRAWNTLARRFLACSESDEQFRASLKRAGTAPQPEERNIQEKVLFHFFCDGFSAIECLCYALFTMGNHLRSDDFPLQTPRQLKNIYPHTTRQTYEKAFRGEPITRGLTSLCVSTEFVQWKEIRNVLSHRGQPGRLIIAGDNPEHDAIWHVWDVPIGEKTTTTRREWLSDTLRDLLVDTHKFVSAHF